MPGRKAQEHLKFDYTPGYIHPDAVDIEFKHALKVYAVDAKTGKIAWERTAYDGVMFDDRHRKNTFASSTMVTDGERAYAFFESAGLYAYDFKGTLVWKKDLGGIIKAGLGPGHVADHLQEPDHPAVRPGDGHRLVHRRARQEDRRGSVAAGPGDAAELGDAAA